MRACVQGGVINLVVGLGGICQCEALGFVDNCEQHGKVQRLSCTRCFSRLAAIVPPPSQDLT
eukprot:1157952-Amphidinium_carterae.1